MPRRSTPKTEETKKASRNKASGEKGHEKAHGEKGSSQKSSRKKGLIQLCKIQGKNLITPPDSSENNRIKECRYQSIGNKRSLQLNAIHKFKRKYYKMFVANIYDFFYVDPLVTEGGLVRLPKSKISL